MPMNRIPRAVSCWLALVLCAADAALAAKGELIDIAWAADGSFARELRVAPGHFVEVCGTLAAGSAVGWRFESGRPLDFNIHFHEGQAVRYPARRAGVARAEGTLEVPTGQDYCWMWTNPLPAEAALSVVLRRR